MMSGTSGVVYKLVEKKDNSRVFAGKQLDISNEENRRDVNTEVQRLIQYSSTSTIQIYATYYFQDSAWVSPKLRSISDLRITDCVFFSIDLVT